MATPNPISRDYPPSPYVSKKSYCIAGIIVDVYGLQELGRDVKSVTCLWLLHPRLSKKEKMQPIAAASIAAWHEKSRTSSTFKERGIVAIAFDQRNHGTRLVSKLANEAWAGGNPTHAVDMFSIFQGTASDTSQLISYLPAYLFPEQERKIVSHMALGISLGGHAVWHCLLHDERIDTGIVVIGCADYGRLMASRAGRSKLHTWTSTDPLGRTFKGSKDYPQALVQSVDRYDPASLLIGEITKTSPKATMSSPNDEQKARLMPLMRDHLQGKRIFNLAGGEDKLVPHSCSKPFLDWLQNAISPGGWYAGQDIHVKDKVYPGVGHAFSPEMMRDAVAFITDTISWQVKDPVSRF